MFPNPVVSFNGMAVYQCVKYLEPMGYEFQVIYPIAHAPLPLRWFGKWKKISKTYPLRHDHNGIKMDFPRFRVLTSVIPIRHWGSTLWMELGKKLISETLNYKPDLIWAQSAIPNGWAAMKLSKRLGIPYVIVIHGSDINETSIAEGGEEKLSEIYTNASLVIPVSERLFREGRRIAPEAKFKLIHFGIEPEILEEAGKERERWENNRSSQMDFIVLSVCNLIKTKGIQYNLQALSRMKRKFPELKYRIVGDGPYKQYLQNLTIKLKLQNSVKFLGKLEYDKAKLEMARSDIFSMPSYKEGIPLVYLESMSLGIPTIGCSDQVPDLITNLEDGFLVEPHNVDQIGDVWSRLIQDNDLRLKIGKRAKSKIFKDFVWNKTSKMYDSAFKQAAGLPGGTLR